MTWLRKTLQNLGVKPWREIPLKGLWEGTRLAAGQNGEFLAGGVIKGKTKLVVLNPSGKVNYIDVRLRGLPKSLTLGPCGVLATFL